MKREHELIGLFFAIWATSGVICWQLLEAAPPRIKAPPATLIHQGQTLYRVDSPDVHDVDTLTDGVIRLPFGAAVAGRKIRSDFDGWEITRSRQTVQVTDEELAKGRAAKSALEERLATHRLYVAELPKGKDIDPYDRIDAVWYFRSPDGTVESVADWARANKHLRK